MTIISEKFNRMNAVKNGKTKKRPGFSPAFSVFLDICMILWYLDAEEREGLTMKRILALVLVLMALTGTVYAESQEYFESDDIVNDFFIKYNSIAIHQITPDMIKRGNIDTKAIVYADGFNIEIINVSGRTLDISIKTNPENEKTVLLTVFSDCIKAMNPTLSDEEILSAWKEMHKTGYMVNDYDFAGIIITYVPSKKLSWGINNPRVDLTFSFDE